MSDVCSNNDCPRKGRFFSEETCPECGRKPFRGNENPTDPAPPGSDPPVPIPTMPPPSKALHALVGASLLLVLGSSCTSPTRPTVASAATVVRRVGMPTVQLHDAAGTPFEVPSERMCETRPAEQEGAIIFRFRFRSELRLVGVAHFIRVVGQHNVTLALGFFTPRNVELTACYLALERGKTIVAIQSGVVEHLSN